MHCTLSLRLGPEKAVHITAIKESPRELELAARGVPDAAAIFLPVAVPDLTNAATLFCVTRHCCGQKPFSSA
eukprot:6206015-Pleurochrysis_carterae.AAC.7